MNDVVFPNAGAGLATAGGALKLKLNPVDAGGDVIEIGGEVTEFAENPEALPNSDGAGAPKVGAVGAVG